MAPPAQIFVSYAHQDRAVTGNDAQWLRQAGYSVFMDEQIEPGQDWADVLAARISDCTLVLFFASQASLASTHCRNELTFAVDARKPVVPVFLEPCDLAGGIKLMIARTQGIARWQLPEDEYYRQVRYAIGDLEQPLSATGSGDDSLVWVVSLSRNPSFSGRESELTALATQFTQSNIVALTGQAGVGKTQLALEYLHRNSATAKVIAWVRAEDSASTINDLIELAQRLNLCDHEHVDTPQVLERLQSWLANRSEWLIVLDNLDSPSALAEYFPTRIAGRILITSRRPNWGRHAQVAPLETFTTQESLAFLQSRIGSVGADDATRLANALGHLPLAMEEAAAYIDATGRSLASYVELFEQHHDSLMATAEPVPDYPHTLRATLRLATAQLEAETPQALELLKWLAVLAPDGLARTMLETLPFASSDQTGPASLLLDQSAKALRRYSLIKANDDLLSIHRLTQLVVRDEMTSSQRKQKTLEALDCISAQFPRVSEMSDTGQLCRHLLPHSLAVVSHAQQYAESHLKCGVLLGRTGTFMSARNLSREADQHLGAAYALLKPDEGNRNKFARTCELYGRVLFANGNLEASIRIFTEALDVFMAEGLPGALHVMQIQLDLAWVRWTKGDLRIALEHARASVEKLESLSGPADPHRAIGQAIISRLELELGNPQQALIVVNEAAAAVPGMSSPDRSRMPLLSAVYIQLAQVLRTLGLPERARSWVQESLQLGAPVYSQYHPLMGASQCVLGQIHFDEQNYEEAQQALEAAVECADQFGYPMNQQVYIASCYLALTHIARGNEDAAAALIDRQLTNLPNRIAGDRTLTEAYAQLARGRLAALQNRHTEALTLGRSGDQIIAQRYGERSLFRLFSLAQLAIIANQAGLSDQAVEAHELAISVAARVDQPAHLHCAEHYALWAEQLEAAGESQRAAELLTQALNIRSASLRPQSAAITTLRERLRRIPERALTIEQETG